MTQRMAKSSAFGYLAMLVCSVYTHDSLGDTSYHTRVWMHEILVHSQGYGSSQSVVGKVLSVTSVASPVNLWWRTAH